MYFPAIAYISEASIIIPTVTGIIQWKKLEKSAKWLVLYCLLCVVAGIVEYLLAASNTRNLFVFHFFNLFHFLIITHIFKLLLPGKKKFCKVLTFEMYAFVVVWLILQFTIEPLNKVDTYSGILDILLLVITSLYTFREILMDTSSNILHSFTFWFTTAVMVFAVSQLFSVGLINNFLLPVNHKDKVQNRETLLLLYYIPWTLGCVESLLYAIALLCKPSR